MKKKYFSAEILCLFFIISTSILFGKTLLDVKTVLGAKINQYMPQPTIRIEYKAFSYKYKKEIEDLEELTIIKNTEELEKFKDKLDEEDIDISWLNEKLKNHEEEFFNDHVLAIICIVNDNNISSTRINGVTKKNDYVTVGVTKKIKDFEPSKKYTWLAVLEIADVESKFVVETTKN
ncbi:MAG: hypothetical protein IJN90_01830 [Bacilli bacterium]|nr:hypothetical protein [Bacilli bacterium]